MGDEIKKQTFKLLSYNDFIVTLNKCLNSGKIKELDVIPLTNYSTSVILTNSLKELYKKEVPKNYYGNVEFDFEWEINLNHE